MKKNSYFILIVLFLMGCTGEAEKKPNPLDNNQTTENNTTTEDKNQTVVIDNENNQTVVVDNNTTTENNQTVVVENNTTAENNQTVVVENNTTAENNQTVVVENNTTAENNQTVIVENPPPTTEDTPTVEKKGKAQLGVLSKATIKLYELNKVERKLLATTTTSGGETIQEIGNFNLYLEKLEDNKFYLYEVSSGKDYDVNDDGVIDNNPTTNKGTFHLLVKGSHIKAIKKASVTVVSEIVYQKLIPHLSLENSQIENKMKAFSKEVIKEDINDDGFVGIEDILRYNPILDKTKLHLEYQNKILQIINDILNDRAFDLSAPIFKNKNSTISINENLIFVQKIEITDASKFTVKLLGDDADKFSYNTKTQELFLLKKPDFENPHDKNSDNSFEFIIEATDSYFNQTQKNFSIKIIDIDEVIPQAPILEDTNLSINEDNDNNKSNVLIGTVIVKNKGTKPIDSFKLIEEESQPFTIDSKGQIFSSKSFDYETKKSYSFKAEALNSVGKSNQVNINLQIEDIPDIKPIVQNVSITVAENRPINTLIGELNISNRGDSNISKIVLTGYKNSDFKVTPKGEINVLIYLDYEAYNAYTLQYMATNEAGDSEKADLTVTVTNIFENSGSDYPPSEDGIQSALDNSDYDFVLNQLLNNRDAYSGMDNNTVNMNIAGAYVGSSGYTVFDITGAMNDGNRSNFNGFVNSITKNNDSVDTINKLTQADTYYSRIIQGVDCTDTTGLTQLQKDSCYNLGLVRLTSLTNSVKLLFGGDSTTVQKWAKGVDINSSDDLNGNGVLDTSDASACAVVYANDPNDNCKNGTIYSYRGGVKFYKQGREYALTLIEIDVGNTTNGYQNFYHLISSNTNNNTPILTSGTCNKYFTKVNYKQDGTIYFPCPALDSNGDTMGIKQSIEKVANIQALFPNGSETQTTTKNYIKNITGDENGTIGLDNLSTYLRTH